jgi:methyl-accepting chemotaxis protein
MLSTISGRITLILLSFAFLLGVGALASHLVLSRQADDALVVNLAGRQRMLTQKMTKEAAELVNLFHEGGDPTQLAGKREQLQNTVRVFETTLLALKEGGSAPLNLEMTKMRPLQAASVPDIQKQLETVKTTWDPFKKSMTSLIASGGSDTAAAKAVMSSNLQLMDQMNTAVSLMQTDSEQKVSVLVAGVGAWVARATIAGPLVQLAAAARSMSTGDLNVELNLKGAREVQELGASFDRMRASMVATLGGASLSDDDL